MHRTDGQVGARWHVLAQRPGCWLPLMLLVGCASAGTTTAGDASATNPVVTRPELSGHVVDESGSGVGDAWVEAFGHGLDQTPVALPSGQTALIFLYASGISPRGDRTIQSVVPLSAKTGADGRFTLQLPAGGVYNIEALMSPDRKAWKSKIDASQANVALADMAVAAISVLSGRPTMPVTAGSPEGAQVDSAGSVYRTSTDANGAYRSGGVPSGTVDMVAFKGNWRGKAVCIAVAPGSEATAPDAPEEIAVARVVPWAT